MSVTLAHVGDDPTITTPGSILFSPKNYDKQFEFLKLYKNFLVPKQSYFWEIPTNLCNTTY